MRKMLLVLVVFGLGVRVDHLLQKEMRVAEAGKVPECAPLLTTPAGVVIQDMDGDGALNPITEALRLLSWAFLGAPAPVPPCAVGGQLPDTGQTKCFDQNGGKMACDSTICPGQDGAYSTGCSNEGRFVDNGDGTVADQCTGLTWQKDTGNGGIPLTWCSALTYCENLDLAGHTDWRLPNVRELQSIVDYGRVDPAIDPVFGALASFYWSSTSLEGGPGVAWIIRFGIGFVLPGSEIVLEGNEAHVRAVRSGA